MDTSLASIKDRFIQFLTDKGRATATVLAYGKDVDQLAQYLTKSGRKDIAAVSEEDLQSFLKKLQDDGYTQKSVSRKINSIKTLYRFLVGEGILQQNVAGNIKHPHIEHKEPRVLSKMEYRALRDTSREDERISAIIELFLQTGIRIGELAQIKMEDVADGELIVRNARGKLDRKVPLNSSSADSLKRYKEVRPESDSERLFITKTGRPLLVRNIRTAIDRYFKEAGIKDCTVNDLRNTFIAHQLANNAPLEYVSEIVGHKRVSTTEKYLDLVDLGDSKSKDPKLQEL